MLSGWGRDEVPDGTGGWERQEQVVTASISPSTGCSQLFGKRPRNCESIGFWPFQVWWIRLCHLPVSVPHLLLQSLLHFSLSPHHPPALLFLHLLLSFRFTYLAQPSASPLSPMTFLLPPSLFPLSLLLLSPTSSLLAAAFSPHPLFATLLCHPIPSPILTNIYLFAKGHFYLLKPTRSATSGHSESCQFLLGLVGCMEE